MRITRPSNSLPPVAGRSQAHAVYGGVTQGIMNKGHWFTSTIFEIAKGEDEATNPGCYGKKLAEWLCIKFKSIGYTSAEVMPEDWGWCVMCSKSEVSVWVGCGIVQTEETINSYNSENPPKGSEVIWHVFPCAEVSIFNFSVFFKKLLGKVNIQEHENKLANELEQILKNEQKIVFCNEP